MKEYTMIIDDVYDGKELYTVLRVKYSVREIKALLANRTIYVNGRHILNKKYIVRKGDVVECDTIQREASSYSIDILLDNADYIAIYKPPYTHSAFIYGSSNPSMEEALRKEYEFYQLCTRLDYPTSGILLAAKHKKAYDILRKHENERLLIKEYQALVEGIPYPTTISFAINTARRKKSKVNLNVIDEENRSTKLLHIIPHTYIGEPCAIITCSIYKGSRHQIRAHLASIGYPLIGDYLYGACIQDQPMFLHNIKLKLFGEYIIAPKPPLWEEYGIE